MAVLKSRRSLTRHTEYEWGYVDERTAKRDYKHIRTLFSNLERCIALLEHIQNQDI